MRTCGSVAPTRCRLRISRPARATPSAVNTWSSFPTNGFAGRTLVRRPEPGGRDGGDRHAEESHCRDRGEHRAGGAAGCDPAGACTLGWQESPALLAKLVEAIRPGRFHFRGAPSGSRQPAGSPTDRLKARARTRSPIGRHARRGGDELAPGEREAIAPRLDGGDQRRHVLSVTRRIAVVRVRADRKPGNRFRAVRPCRRTRRGLSGCRSRPGTRRWTLRVSAARCAAAIFRGQFVGWAGKEVDLRVAIPGVEPGHRRIAALDGDIRIL